MKGFNNYISDIKKDRRWTNTRPGIWHKEHKPWKQIYYEKECPHCKRLFAASTMHVKYCSNSCHSSVTQLGEKSHRWKGGRISSGRGYILILKRDHPYACKPNFYVLEHRLVMENKLGRYLRPEEIVHHINGIKDDNRIENLVVTTQSEHIKHHSLARWSDQTVRQKMIKAFERRRRRKRHSEQT